MAPDGSPVLNVLQRIAKRIERSEGDAGDDFEKLVGAFETQAALIDDLEDLVDLAPEADEDLAGSIKKSAEFARRICDIGTGTVLSRIFERSEVDGESRKRMLPFFKALIDEFSGRIDFVNLNYDGLAMAALQQVEAPMCDLANGAIKAEVNISKINSEGERELIDTYTARPLRKVLDFPPGSQYRVRLIHPHGSITYWHHRDSERAIKIPIEVLRANNVLDTMKKRPMNMYPAVVLSNSLEKPRRTREYPFRLGYEALRYALHESSYWLIAGYSFRDETVNEEVRSALSARSERPKVLVSTFGDELEGSFIKEKIGWIADSEDADGWLEIDRGGIAGLVERQVWESFVE